MCRHRQSLDDENIRPDKLPLIPNKNNIEGGYNSFIKSSQRVNSYILFEKGLGSYGTVHIKKSRGNGRYMNDNNKFVKLYSESSEQEIEMIK